MVRSNGLASTLQDRIDSIRYRGLSRDQLIVSMGQYPLATNMLDLLDHGQRAPMKPEFIPNGGIRVRQSKSYREHSSLCNKHLFKLQSEGDAIIIEKSSLSDHDIASTNFNTVILATSSNPNREGRCCINLGYSAPGPRGNRSKRSLSFNDGYDLTESDKLYPPSRLPDIRDICELACVQRARYEGVENLSSATMDVYKAYRQVIADLSTTMLSAIEISVNDKLLVVYTYVGFFGHVRTGHAYNVSGGYINYKHNLSHQLEHPETEGEIVSITYIDDTGIITGESLIEKSRDSLRDIIRGVNGPTSVKPEKDVLSHQDMEMIGWSINLRYKVWRVSPKPRAIIKIYAAIFYMLPMNFCDENHDILISKRTLLQVASLLNWYSVGLKLGDSFVHSIYKNAGWGSLDSLQTISLNCKRDISWWRILAIASMKDPYFLSTDISSLRRIAIPTIFVCGDACTGVGGGGWLGSSLSEESSGNETYIRWSPTEFQAFDQFQKDHDGKPVDINVLEYFVIMYLVMLWGPQLKGKVVGIQCDNSAAVSWLQRNRGSNKSPISETLCHVFSLFIISYDITLVVSHIKGILNVKSDYLSRDPLLQSLEVPNQLLDERVDSKAEDWWIGLSRKVILRTLLHASVAMPWTTPSQQTLRLLKALL